MKIDLNFRSNVLYTNMAAVSLFWNTNMVAVTSYERSISVKDRLVKEMEILMLFSLPGHTIVISNFKGEQS